MNDSHNLGMKVSESDVIENTLTIFILFSLEVDASFERLGKTFITENSE